jgi:hypothetical protein
VHSITIAFVAAVLVTAAGACVPSEESPPPRDAASGVTYTKDVQPILMAKCGTCHGGMGMGNHNIASNYDDVHRHAESLQFDECWENVATMTGPKTLGECAHLLSRAGKMPAFLGCDRPQPDNPAACVTMAEVEVLSAWVAAGMPR